MGRDNDEKAQFAPPSRGKRQPSSTCPSCHAGHAFQGLNIKHPKNVRILSWRETRMFSSRRQHAQRKSESSGGFRTCQNHHAGQGFQHVREMTTRSVTMRGAVSPPKNTPVTEPVRLNPVRILYIGLLGSSGINMIRSTSPSRGAPWLKRHPPNLGICEHFQKKGFRV